MKLCGGARLRGIMGMSRRVILLRHRGSSEPLRRIILHLDNRIMIIQEVTKMEHINNVIALYDTEYYRAAEGEKARNALKFFIATAVLRRLLADKLISKREFALTRDDLAKNMDSTLFNNWREIS